MTSDIYKFPFRRLILDKFMPTYLPQQMLKVAQARYLDCAREDMDAIKALFEMINDAEIIDMIR